VNDDDASSVNSSVDGSSRSPTKKSSSNGKAKTKPMQFVGGRVLWTLIPSSFIASIAGPLFFLPQVPKMLWCRYAGSDDLDTGEHCIFEEAVLVCGA
jgi:hypothetical protein